MTATLAAHPGRLAAILLTLTAVGAITATFISWQCNRIRRTTTRPRWDIDWPLDDWDQP